MHLEKDVSILQESRNSFFDMIRRDEELDESEFVLWKNELERELPIFWAEMNRSRKR
jgi:hypothetical protein